MGWGRSWAYTPAAVAEHSAPVEVAGTSLTPPALGRLERKRPQAYGARQAGLFDLED